MNLPKNLKTAKAPQTDPLYSTTHILTSFVLAFAAGSLNVGGYMAFGRFVSHVTGFATMFGAEGARGHWLDAFELLSVPVFFVLGAMLSGYLIDRKRHAGEPPDLHIAMWIVSLNLFAASWLGHAEFFSLFGGGLDLHRDYLLLAMLSMASGTMNALITSSSNGVLRSTHLTGTTTDLGLGIVRVMYPSRDGHRHAREVRANWLRGGTIAFFVLGSIVGGFLFLRVEYNGFFLPTAIALGIALFLTFYRMEHPHRA